MTFAADAQLLEQIAAMVGFLREPLSDESARHGWTQATAEKWLHIFERLHADISNSAATAQASLSRAMDHDGVTGGHLLEKAASISNALRRRAQ
ncbi:hypothetical protein AB4Z46_33275 [Variovorax sp. M-6]|uniref:hypothetical protein n=1 Tax=Variovorax sp. M-6 TaxID=3233041 RepID=UPI003F9EB790